MKMSKKKSININSDEGENIQLELYMKRCEKMLKDHEKKIPKKMKQVSHIIDSYLALSAPDKKLIDTLIEKLVPKRQCSGNSSNNGAGRADTYSGSSNTDYFDGRCGDNK